MVTQEESVFLFIGNDKYLKEEALKDLRSSLQGKSSDQSDQITFYGDELDPEDLFSRLNTIPLLAQRPLIVIKCIEKVADEIRAGLIEYIRRPSKSAYLVLDAQDDSALKDYDEVVDKIRVRRIASPTAGALTSWMKNYAASNGKVISGDALAILKELEGNDLSYLSRELDKLITFAGDRKEIGPDDVEGLIGRSLAMSAFDIADAIGRKDIEGAIKITSNLIASGRREHEIIGILSWYLKRMLRARTLKDRGESDHGIASLLRIGHRFQSDFFRQLSGFNLEKIKSNIELLLKADLEMKRPKFDPATVLEFTLMRLCLL